MLRNRAGRSERLPGAPYQESALTFGPCLEASSGQTAGLSLNSKTAIRSPAFSGICPIPAASANGTWLNAYLRFNLIIGEDLFKLIFC